MKMSSILQFTLPDAAILFLLSPKKETPLIEKVGNADFGKI